jgi:non-specific serine/threonine protein kinase
VAAICRRLDGLPLAIELAAARVRLFPPAALLGRLERRLPLLTGGGGDLPARLRTMRGAIAWSHDILSPNEQRMFRRLAAFVGGFTLAAASVLTGEANGQEGDVVGAVTALVEHSLLHRLGDDDEPRFGMLETIREYGLDLLAASGDEGAVRTAHARYFLHVAEEANAVFWGRRPGPWRGELQSELPNLRAALAWLIETGDGEAALRLATALEPLWWISHQSEGRRWLTRALALRDDVADDVVAAALVVAGGLANDQGDHAEAAARGQEALALAEGAGTDPADARYLLGIVAMNAEDPALRSEGKARAHLEAALASYRLRAEPIRAAFTLCRLANLILRSPAADLDQAQRKLDEAMVIFRGTDHVPGTAITVFWLGEVARRRGDGPAAAKCYREALTLHVATGQAWCVAGAFEGFAWLAVETGAAETAARLWGAAVALRDTLGLPLPDPYMAAYDAAVARVRATLGTERFAAAWDDGRSRPMAEVVAEADGFAARMARSSPSTIARVAVDATGLTPREVEVLRLLVEGKSDREIAEVLFVSRHTAANHVGSILGKLGVPSRAAAAAVAVRQGLV